MRRPIGQREKTVGLIVLCLLFTTHGGGSSPSPRAPAGPISVAPSSWFFQYGIPGGVTNTNAGIRAAPVGFQFTFPTCPLPTPPANSACNVGYLIAPVTRLTVSRTVSASFQVTTAGNPEFSYLTVTSGPAANACGPGSPATVRLYLEVTGDNLFVPTGRWFSNTPTSGWPLGSGLFNLSADLSIPKNWIDAGGNSGDMQPAAFNAAMSNLQAVGVVFGGGCFAGHGAFVVQGSGTAVFNMQSYIAE
jgi:hypothetical protein